MELQKVEAPDGFNAESYLNNFADLRNVFGDNHELAN